MVLQMSWLEPGPSSCCNIKSRALAEVVRLELELGFSLPSQGGTTLNVSELQPASQGQNLAVTAVCVPSSLHRNVLWYGGGLGFEAHRLLFDSA